MKVSISRVQLVFLMVWGVLGTGSITIPFIIAKFTVRDGWIVILMFLGTAATVSATIWLFNRVFPNGSLLEVFNQVFGPRLGRMATLLGVVWAYVFMGMIVRELTLFVEVTALPKTPLYVTSGLITFAFAYAVYRGIEVIGRLAELFSVAAITVFVVLLLLPLPVADFHVLQPILANGWTPVLRAAITPDISFGLELMVGLQLLHIAKERNKVAQDVLTAGAIISSLLMIGYILVVGVLGNAAAHLAYPGLEVIRSIRYGQLVERLDTLLVMVILVTMFLKFSVFHFVLCDFLRHTFQLTSIKSISFPAGAAVWGASILFFKNSSELQNFMLYVTPVWFITVLLGLPFVTMAVWSIKRRLLRHTQV